MNAIQGLVEDCGSFVSLEREPLVGIISVPGLPDHLEVCGRKMPMTATVYRALECYEAILKEYGDRSRKASVEGGIDWKALGHAFRVNEEALELLQTGWITFPRPEAGIILEIKSGRKPAEHVYAMIEHGMADLVKAHKESKLQDTPDTEFADFMITKEYGWVVARG
jgi:hypothetical protein